MIPILFTIIWLAFVYAFYKKYSMPLDNIHVDIILPQGPPLFLKDYTKLAFQTYRDKSLIPSKVEENWKEFAPEYTRIVLDDQEAIEFLQRHYSPNVTEKFMSLTNGAHKADLLRYCILYVYGGLYADIKTVWIRPVRELFPYPNKFYTIFIGQRHPFLKIMNVMFGVGFPMIYNGVIFSPPKNPLFLLLIKHILATPNWILTDYLHICTYMYSLLESLAGSPLTLGPMTLPRGFPQMVCYEEVHAPMQMCEYQPDRYGNCVYIQNENRELIIRVRYPDFPWK